MPKIQNSPFKDSGNVQNVQYEIYLFLSFFFFYIANLFTTLINSVPQSTAPVCDKPQIQDSFRFSKKKKTAW